LQDLGNVARVLKFTQVDVCARLLDGVSDQLGRARLTLCADDCGLLFLTSLVDDKGGALGFLLGNLLGLDGGGELGREGEVLGRSQYGWMDEEKRTKKDIPSARHHRA
jgi:hypothetical protein